MHPHLELGAELWELLQDLSGYSAHAPLVAAGECNHSLRHYVPISAERFVLVMPDNPGLLSTLYRGARQRQPWVKRVALSCVELCRRLTAASPWLPRARAVAHQRRLILTRKWHIWKPEGDVEAPLWLTPPSLRISGGAAVWHDVRGRLQQY